MSGIIEHCYEIGLRIQHTNWRCCTLDLFKVMLSDKFPLQFIFTQVGYCCRPRG